ncbi:unnamed protein product [Paramecium octaurelia]|uniref:1-alkyl-2-acetylglycerophosphocholine esterase n=1 Tax=Paramecium octaurelia TaxID=43137 RepID=A0A8S1SYA2_PAROT|nr:unnamed protein product [Paramecium octaurelia]
MKPLIFLQDKAEQEGIGFIPFKDELGIQRDRQKGTFSRTYNKKYLTHLCHHDKTIQLNIEKEFLVQKPLTELDQKLEFNDGIMREVLSTVRDLKKTTYACFYGSITSKWKQIIPAQIQQNQSIYCITWYQAKIITNKGSPIPQEILEIAFKAERIITQQKYKYIPQMVFETNLENIAARINCIRQKILHQKIKSLSNLFYLTLTLQQSKIIFKSFYSIVYSFIELQNSDITNSIKLVDLDNVGPVKKNSHANHNSYFDLFGFFGLCIWLILKYFFEGFRFNSIIIMAACIFFIFDRALQFADKILCKVAAVLTILYIYTLISYPVYQFPKTTGNYRTCYKQIKLHDTYQTDASVYYPCVDNQQEDIEFKWLPDNKFAKQLYEISVLQTKWVPSEWVFDIGLGFLNFINFTASVEQPLLKEELDVIIFSHGFSQHRNAYTALCQQLASEGYVVFSLQHYELVYPWDIKATKIYNTGNHPDTIEKYQKIRSSHLKWRTEQVQQLINTLKSNQIKDVFFDFNLYQLIQLVIHLEVPLFLELLKKSMLIMLLLMIHEQMHKQIKSKTLILSKNKVRVKQECFDPKLLKDFLDFNTSIEHYKIKGLDHAYPVDLTYLIAAEMVLIGELRNDDNVFKINSLINSLTSKFLQQKLFSIEENKLFC